MSTNGQAQVGRIEQLTERGTLPPMPPTHRHFVEIVDDVRVEIARLNTAVRVARDERDRARALAADLEGMISQERVILTEALNLLRWAVSPTSSHAVEEQVGKDIAEFIREHGPVIGC